MISSRSRYGLLGVLLLPVLAAAGCTGSETLSPTSQTLSIELRIDNNVTQFELGSFQLNQLDARPTDAAGDESLGNLNLGMLLNSVELTFDQAMFQTGVALPDNVYELQAIRINPIQFLDLDPLQPGYTCQEYNSWFWSSNVVISDFGQDVLINVENGTENRFIVGIDGQAFVDAFLDAWTCKTVGCPGGQPLCPSSFSQAAFTSRASEFLSFE